MRALQTLLDDNLHLMPVLVTMAYFQGHRGIRKVKAQVVRFFLLETSHPFLFLENSLPVMFVWLFECT